MSDAEWRVLFVQHADDGPLGPDAMMMLHLEAELTAQGIDTVFDPRRPGEYFPSKYGHPPIKLMVRYRDFTRAREVADAVTSGNADMLPLGGEDQGTFSAEEPEFVPRADHPASFADSQRIPPAIQPGCLISMLTLLIAWFSAGCD